LVPFGQRLAVPRRACRHPPHATRPPRRSGGPTATLVTRDQEILMSRHQGQRRPWSTPVTGSPGEGDELLHHLVDATQVGPPDVDELPPEQANATLATAVARLRGGCRMPLPALALDTDAQRRRREVELGDEPTAIVVHR